MATKLTDYHDITFFAVFAAPEQTAQLLRRFGPGQLDAALNLASMRPRLRAHLTPAGRWRRADLVFEGRLRASPAPVLLNVEHASGPDGTLMARQLLYAGLGLTDWQERKQQSRGAVRARLPAYLPIVLYHAARRWPPGRSLSGRYLGREHLPAELLACAPEIAPHVIDLHAISDSEIAGEPLFRLTLLCFKHIQRPSFVPMLKSTADEWRALAQEKGLRGLRILLRYVAWAAPGDGFETLKRILASCDGRAKEEIMTAAERFRREGFKQGIEKGIEKGIGQGKAAVVLKQLRLRFGELPPDVEERVSKASEVELDTWTERVLSAPDLQSCVGTPGASPTPSKAP